MEKISYAFSAFNKNASDGIRQALYASNCKNKPPIFVCVGSDLVLGDSLGPLVGTMLKKKDITPYVYGTLNYPVTAKEVEYVNTYISGLHPETVTIAIDAGVGELEDVGNIKVSSTGLKPGLALNKKLGTIGQISIVGIVAEKSKTNYALYNLTRLNLIYKMAEVISSAIEEYVKSNFELDQSKIRIV